MKSSRAWEYPIRLATVGFLTFGSLPWFLFQILHMSHVMWSFTLHDNDGIFGQFGRGSSPHFLIQGNLHTEDHKEPADHDSTVRWRRP